MSETSITKAGQVKHFQIRLLKQAFKIVGIETDVFAQTKFRQGDAATYPYGNENGTVIPKMEHGITIPDFTASAVSPIAQLPNSNVVGKITLQSMERENIFFSDWVKASVFYEGFIQPTSFQVHVGLKDIRGKTTPKKVDVPVESTIINAMYRDNIGKQTKQDISYTLKVFVWIETNGEANGVAFEFLNSEKETTEK